MFGRYEEQGPTRPGELRREEESALSHKIRHIALALLAALSCVSLAAGTYAWRDLENWTVTELEGGVRQGELVLRKTVRPEGMDGEFTFTVSLADGAAGLGREYGVLIDDVLQDKALRSGENTVTLRGGQTLTVLSVQPGTRYLIRELPSAGWSIESSGASGIMTAGGAAAEFINTYNETPLPGSLTVAKRVTGGGPPDAAFSFTAVIGAETYQFTLKDGEERVFPSIAAGMLYTVIEETAADYVQSVTGSAGTIDGDRRAEFTNAYTGAPVPTETPEPTDSPQPTQSPEPTRTPEPPPTGDPDGIPPGPVESNPPDPVVTPPSDPPPTDVPEPLPTGSDPQEETEPPESTQEPVRPAPPPGDGGQGGGQNVGSPKTGDASQAKLWLALFLGSLGAFLLLLIAPRRSRYQGKRCAPAVHRQTLFYQGKRLLKNGSAGGGI